VGADTAIFILPFVSSAEWGGEFTQDDEPSGELVGVDPWSAVLPGPSLVPAYLASRFAAQYRVIVDALLEAQDTSLTGMSVQDVEDAVRDRLIVAVGPRRAAELLESPAFNLETRLARLEKWEVVTRWQEPARTGEDFLRRRDRYQLTALASRLHAFWLAAVDGADEASSGDVTLAPRAILERISAFSAALDQADFVVAAGEFQQVMALHEAMARAARAWQRTLAHALSGGPDPTKQEAVWTTLQAYVAMWGEQVDVYSPRIRDVVESTEPALTDPAIRACVRAALADAAPEEIVDAQLARWRRTWTALRTWFVDDGGQARRLRRQLRDVVAPWARNMHILMATGGTVTRRAEMIQLAAAIERAATDAEAYRIWDTALGSFSARHLLVSGSADGVSGHVQADSPPSWWDAPPAPVTAKFRSQGPRAVVERRSRLPNFRVGRDAARQARAAANAARRTAEASLRQRSGTNLSEWGAIEEAELDLLLDLLGTARRAGRAVEGVAGMPDGRGERLVATSGDGRWRVIITAPPDPACTARLRSARGDFVTADWRFEMEPAR
jgi:uncharacterized protein (TIGR02677 family)